MGLFSNTRWRSLPLSTVTRRDRLEDEVEDLRAQLSEKLCKPIKTTEVVRREERTYRYERETTEVVRRKERSHRHERETTQVVRPKEPSQHRERGPPKVKDDTEYLHLTDHECIDGHIDEYEKGYNRRREK